VAAKVEGLQPSEKQRQPPICLAPDCPTEGALQSWKTESKHDSVNLRKICSLQPLLGPVSNFSNLNPWVASFELEAQPNDLGQVN